MTEVCDTSVLIAALSQWHPLHTPARTVLGGTVRAIPAHVLAETYSVLTRLPAPHRLSPQIAGAAVSALRHDLIQLPVQAHRDLIATLGPAGLAGGAVYDALIAATALHHRMVMVSADRRAQPAYERVGVTVRLLPTTA